MLTKSKHLSTLFMVLFLIFSFTIMIGCGGGSSPADPSSSPSTSPSSSPSSSPSVSPSPSPEIVTWQKCLGGSGSDTAYTSCQTSDGGYVIASQTDSNDGDVSGINGEADFWIVKFDSDGNISWSKCFGGTKTEQPFAIQQTKDNGYIVVGNSNSSDGDLTENNGLSDFWILKLDSSGNLDWQKSLGGSNDESARSVQQTSDNGYIVAGHTYSNDGDVTGNNGEYDYWIVKLDQTGAVSWSKCLGGSANEYLSEILQTSDNGYIVTGRTNSNDGDVSGNNGDYDYWVVKLDSSGDIEWQNPLGGSSFDRGSAITKTSDGGYLAAGYSNSNNGDVSGNNGNYDSWVVKLLSNGNISWSKCFGGTDNDFSESVQQTSDNGFIVCGHTVSNDGDVSGNNGESDFWITKLNNTGTLLWQKCYGGSKSEYSQSIYQCSDNGFVVVGHTYSNDGYVSGNHNTDGSKYDVWFIKLDDNGDM